MKKNIKINTVGFVGLGVMGMSMFKNLIVVKNYLYKDLTKITLN